MKTSILAEKTFAFACKIVRLVRKIQAEQHEYVLSGQLLRCGTSDGSNNHEAPYAASRKDFINKLTVSLKEAKRNRLFS